MKTRQGTLGPNTELVVGSEAYIEGGAAPVHSGAAGSIVTVPELEYSLWSRYRFLRPIITLTVTFDSMFATWDRDDVSWDQA